VRHEFVSGPARRRAHDSSYYVRQLTALLADTAAMRRLEPSTFRTRLTELFFTAYRETQPALFGPDTLWVYYQEAAASAAEADARCRARLGADAFAGFAAFGARQLSRRTDAPITRAVHAQGHALRFWNVNGRGEPERWYFDGWTTGVAQGDGGTELLCSLTY
jgi:hypothetical protein